MLLLLGDEEGEFLPIREHAFECALAGAVLMDLAFEYRIDTDLQALVVTDPTPTGNPMLDRILAQIKARSDTTDTTDTTDTQAWIRVLSVHRRIGHDPRAGAGEPRGARHPGAARGAVPVGVPLRSLPHAR